MRRRPAPLLLAAALLLPGSARAADDPCRVPPAPRVVAVGDVHGSYDNFVKVLRFSGIVDGEARWAGGRAHLVQTGDLIDRGKDTRKVLDFLMRLEGEAKKAGGRVHALLGNHEAMNLMRDLRYVSAGDYETFQTPESRHLQENVVHANTDRAKERAKAAGEPFDEGEYRAKLMEQIPLGYVERAREFSAEGRYGRWLRERAAMAIVNGVVFVHGGLTPEVAALGCKEVNARVRRELTKDLEATLKDPASTLVAGETGPLWYRGLAREEESVLAPKVDEVLRSLGARAIVVGHTTTKTGRIQSRLEGRVVSIDVGLGETYGGQLAALEVGPDGTLTALYPDGRESQARPAARVRPPLAPAEAYAILD